MRTSLGTTKQKAQTTKRNAKQERKTLAKATTATQRKSAKGKTNVKSRKPGSTAAEAPRSLIQLQTRTATGHESLFRAGAHRMSKAQCLKFLAFEVRRSPEAAQFIKLKGGPDRACDKEREHLQAEFNKAFLTVSDLEQKSRNRAGPGRKECMKSMDSSLAELVAPLVGARSSSTDRAELASQVIAQLKPILNSAGDRVDRLKVHLENLKVECLEDEGATESLNNVRNLIYNLQHCPGAQDFELSVPKTKTA